jgi:ketosteroid isomerase-like protein
VSQGPDNVEVVLAYYDALNAGDVERAMSLCDPKVEYVNPDDAAEPGIRRGAAQYRKVLEGLPVTFADYHCDVRSITSRGDQVLVVEESSGRGRVSEVPFAAIHGHLFTLRDGLIVRFAWFRDVEEMRSAADVAAAETQR